MIGPSLLLLSVLGTVCPNMSRPHPLCLFSKDASRLSSSGVHSRDFYHNFCTACAVTVVTYGHLNLSTYLLTYYACPWASSSSLYWHDDAASAVDATFYHRRPGVSNSSSSSLEQFTSRN